jgi:hypothetical protein
MIKMTLAAALLLTMTACGVMRDQYGNPMNVQDDFECKQRCGFYDPRSSIVGTAMCMNACERAKGYTLHKN